MERAPGLASARLTANVSESIPGRRPPGRRGPKRPTARLLGFAPQGLDRASSPLGRCVAGVSRASGASASPASGAAPTLAARPAPCSPPRPAGELALSAIGAPAQLSDPRQLVASGAARRWLPSIPARRCLESRGWVGGSGGLPTEHPCAVRSISSGAARKRKDAFSCPYLSRTRESTAAHLVWSRSPPQSGAPQSRSPLLL